MFPIPITQSLETQQACKSTNKFSGPNGLQFLTMTQNSTAVLPPDPYQMRVPHTQTYIIFSQYGREISSESFVRLCFEAQATIIEAIIAAKGDGPMPRLRPLWWYADTQMKIYPSDKMTWLMLSHTFTGIVSFVEQFAAVAMDIEILDVSLGSVGVGVISYKGSS